MAQDEEHEIDDVVCKRETTHAILVEIEGVEKWVPKTVICADSEVKGMDDTGRLVVQGWWATKEGMT